ncbi:GNAT family N-acetyltransferase [Legionella shakespearei]|nr:GNAT family N-acetyltransferase [Legionella shakespearei]
MKMEHTDVTLRKIEVTDNAMLEQVIKHILVEFGANKPGFAYADIELTSMYESYQGNDRAYYVAEKNGMLLGGAGFGPLLGAPEVCELKKMYLSADARGLGIGDALLRMLIKEAKDSGYKQLYLETLATMSGAIRLYTKYGFEALHSPLGSSGHFGCDVWMLREL